MSDIKRQVYLDPRPAERFTRFHEHVREHPPGWTYELTRMLLTAIAVPFYRTRAIGTERVPGRGPLIIAPNHFSNMDHFFIGVYLRRKIQFMAKSQLFGNPVLDYVFRVGGVFPVRRGRQDPEPFITASAIFQRGGCIGMYAEGGRSRTGELGRPKPGLGRLALENGVPVVPVAIHGSEGVRRWRKLRFPKVSVMYGEPIHFERVESPSQERQREAAEQVFAEVHRMYELLGREGRRGVLRAERESRRRGRGRAGAQA